MARPMARKYSAAEKLLRVGPKNLRTSVLGSGDSRHMVMVDHSWWRVPIDLSVGDALVVPTTFEVEGEIMEFPGIAEPPWNALKTSSEANR